MAKKTHLPPTGRGLTRCGAGGRSPVIAEGRPSCGYCIHDWKQAQASERTAQLKRGLRVFAQQIADAAQWVVWDHIDRKHWDATIGGRLVFIGSERETYGKAVEGAVFSALHDALISIGHGCRTNPMAVATFSFRQGRTEDGTYKARKAKHPLFAMPARIARTICMDLGKATS